jgi:hypothetical protein
MLSKLWWNRAGLASANIKFMLETPDWARWMLVKLSPAGDSIDGTVIRYMPGFAEVGRAVPAVNPFDFSIGDYIVFRNIMGDDYAGHIAKVTDPGNRTLKDNVIICTPASPKYPHLTEFRHYVADDAQYRVHRRFVEIIGWDNKVKAVPSGALACPRCHSEITRYYRGLAPWCPTCNVFQSSDGHGKPGAWLSVR